jgi:hypothetical protein
MYRIMIVILIYHRDNRIALTLGLHCDTVSQINFNPANHISYEEGNHWESVIYEKKKLCGLQESAQIPYLVFFLWYSIRLWYE